MSGGDVCRVGGRRKANGNCEHPDSDGGALQSVGTWAERKHDQLRSYLDATWAVRSKFAARSGAAYIDLFAGPGRVRIRDSERSQEGSALIAANHSRAPFSKLVFCDIDPENVASLRHRLAGNPRATIFEGDCNECIDDVIREIPPHGLNLALIDPFGARNLQWRTIERLAQVERMDLLIHFPTMDLKRNFLNESAGGYFDVIGTLVGHDRWRERVRKASEIVVLIDVIREGLARYGYVGGNVQSVPIKNDQGGVLYHLMFASKAEVGTKIWKSLTRHSGKQRGLLL